MTLNGLALPSPASLSVRVAPRSGTAQYNTLGQLVQDGIRDKRTVEITWTRMDSAALSALSALLNEGGFFTLIYPDPLSGSREMSCRAKEHSARVRRMQSGAPLWADVTLTLEER